MNPYQPVIDFENAIAEFTHAQYAVAVDSGSNAIFLSLLYMFKDLTKYDPKVVTIPKHTYPSVPCAIIHAGGKVNFSNEPWHGQYELQPYNILDSALHFQKGMYSSGLQCLSFHIKKRIAIGRGGMILTNDKKAADWLRKARFDGRDPIPLLEDDFTMLGWNMYMTPAQAALGLQIFEMIKNKPLPDLPVEEQGYPDLSKFPIYRQ